MTNQEIFVSLKELHAEETRMRGSNAFYTRALNQVLMNMINAPQHIADGYVFEEDESSHLQLIYNKNIDSFRSRKLFINAHHIILEEHLRGRWFTTCAIPAEQLKEIEALQLRLRGEGL